MTAAPTSQMPWWREPTRGQWASFFAAWSGWVLDAFDFTIFLLVMPQIAAEFGVSYTATAASITLTLLVRLVGGVTAGWAADRWGRKLPLMISIVWFAVCDGLVFLAPTFTWVLVLRTLFGFGMGAEWTSGATLAMENWPSRSKGIISGILQGSWAIGYLLAAVATGLIVPTYGWRPLFLVAAIPALLVLPIRIWVPESKEFQKSHRERPKGAPWSVLWKTPDVMKRLAWGSVIMATGFGAYYGMMGLYAPLLVDVHGLPTEEVSSMVALFNVGMLAGAVACGYLAARRSIALAIMLPALLMVGAVPLFVGAIPALLPIGAVLGGMFGAGHAGVTPLLLTSLFPPGVRARCVGLVYHLGAFAAAFVPMGTAALAEHTDLSMGQAIGGVVTASLLLLVAAVYFGPRIRTDSDEGAMVAPLAPASSGASAPDPTAIQSRGER